MAPMVATQTRSVRATPRRSAVSARRAAAPRTARHCVTRAADDVIVVGLAADSGCGKSTFMRRMTGLFGGEPTPPPGGNPDSNTLISDTTTVICLDDYHLNDRAGRKVSGKTALHVEEQEFDLMYEHVKALKEGKTVQKRIYNHVTGVMDPDEEIKAPKILVIEGLHPFVDERGHSLESIKASIEARKPDFDAYVDPQKEFADIVIQVLPTQLIPGDSDGKVLRVRMIQKEGKELFDPAYLFDEGSTISWIPCGRKLTCSYPGLKMFYGPDTWYGQDVSVLELDGQFDKLEELIYLESHLSNTSSKFYGELTQQMLKNSEFPGSNNGTGLFQTLVGLKVREFYELKTKTEVSTEVAA